MNRRQTRDDAAERAVSALRLSALEMPRLRAGVKHRTSNQNSKPTLFLQMPSGTAALVGSDEWTILRYLDGSPLDHVRDRLRAEQGFEFAPGELEGFVSSAFRAGLLDGRESERSRRFHPLFIKIPITNPDVFLDRLEPRLRFLFVPTAWWAGAMVIIAGVWSLGGALPRVGSLDASRLFLFLLSVLVVGTLHELGHALTLKHFRGHVREAGLLVNWCLPGFYCDVTDTYLLERKRHRIAVTLAGPFVQAAVGATCALLLWSQAVSAPSLRLLLNDATIVGFLAPINLLPFFRSDGYYLLSECADMPNLRLRARQCFGAWLFQRPRSRRPLSRRDHVILLLFATLTVVFGTVVIAWLGARALTAITGYPISSVWTGAVACLFVAHGLHRSGAEAS